MKPACRLILALLLACLAGAAGAAGPTPAPITTAPIMHFRPGTAETRFGELDYIGGFSFSSPDRRLHGVSALRFLKNDRFLAVTDTGLWFSARVLRDDDGAPVGLGDAVLAPILDGKGDAQPRKGQADAEGLAIGPDGIFVSFERDHRIERFDRADPMAGGPLETLALPVPRRELRANQGLEAIAIAPRGTPLDGAVVVVSEQSIDAAGNLFAAIAGPRGGVFTVRRHKPWHVTDAAFLPGGDLVLLERRYEGLGRIGMRLRRIDAGAIEPGAIVDGPILMEVDGSHAIDNMEALDIFTDAGGGVVLAIASDDNGSLFQRNLYLEFRYR